MNKDRNKSPKTHESVLKVVVHLNACVALSFLAIHDTIKFKLISSEVLFICVTINISRYEGKAYFQVKQTSNSCVLKDRFNRCVDRFRVSVTLRCNYSCVFCHREGINESLELGEKLSPDDYGFFANVVKKYGINEYKLTGGEPLLRRDIHEIVANLRSTGARVSLSTNGYLLEEKARYLADAGLERINVSLHSLQEKTYQQLTNAPTKGLSKVLNGIYEAKSYGIAIKLNYIYMNSNQKEVFDIVRFAEKNGFDINLIELIPLGTPIHIFKQEHVPLSEIEKTLESFAEKVVSNPFQNRPIYYLPSGIKVTIIKGYANPYLCMNCTRLRLTPDGKIKTCIFIEKNYVDILKPIKERNEEGIVEGLKLAMYIREPYFKL